MCRNDVLYYRIISLVLLVFDLFFLNNKNPKFDVLIKQMLHAACVFCFLPCPPSELICPLNP